MRRYDVDRCSRAARLPNGKYRATASRFADGRPLGYFKYYGTRPDDPNDIHPHEHRRELRGSRVFAAWLNHDDSRGLNSLDMLEGPDGRQVHPALHVRLRIDHGQRQHVAQVPRAGNEYILEWGPALKTLATLGLYVRPWILVDYPDGARPSVGRFEADFFDPGRGGPSIRTRRSTTCAPTMRSGRRDSWRSSRDETIRAVVAKARYSDPGAASTSRDADQAARQGAEGLVDRRQPHRRSGARIGRRVDVRERSDDRRRRLPAHVIRLELVAIRQRDRYRDPHNRGRGRCRHVWRR